MWTATDLICPACPAALVQPADAPDALICGSCNFLWLDGSPVPTAPRPVRPPRPEVGEEPERPREVRPGRPLRPAGGADTFGGSPLRWLPGLFGLPVELSRFVSERRPLGTWGLAMALFAGALVTVSSIPQTWFDWGFVPALPTRRLGLTWVTHFFLHAGVIHLLGNVYYLGVFGEPVEHTLGRRRFLLLVLFSTVGGALAHLLAVESGPIFTETGLGESFIPLVGASGGISGILVFYALRFPRIRFGILLVVLPLRVPVWLIVVFWGALQGLGAANHGIVAGGVAYAAHLGGAAVGVLLWLRWRSSVLR